MNKETITNLFLTYPEAKEIYKDANEQLWISKETAQAQSGHGKVTTYKRTDYVKTSKTE